MTTLEPYRSVWPGCDIRRRSYTPCCYESSAMYFETTRKFYEACSQACSRAFRWDIRIERMSIWAYQG